MPLNHPKAVVDALLEQSEVAILLFDRTGQIVFANQAALQLARKGPAQNPENGILITEAWGEPYDFDGNRIRVNEWPPTLALGGQRTEGREVRMVYADATHYDISLSSAPLRIEDGSIIGAIVSFTDITQRRISEQVKTTIINRLEELAGERARGIHLMHLIGLSASSLTSIKEMFQIALTEICDHMGWPVGYAYIVEPPARLYGITAWYSANPERYKGVSDAIANIDYSSKESVIGQALRQVRTVFIPDVDNESFLRKDAARQAGLRSCLAIPIRVNESPVAILEFFREDAIEPQGPLLEVMEVIGAYLGQVIEQKRAEQKLQAIFDSAPDAQIVTDRAGKIIMANRQTSRLFGYSEREMLGQSVELFVPPFLRTAHIDHRRKYSAAPHPRPMGSGMELRGLCKDKTELPVEISLSPVNSDEGVLVISAIRDVTQRKELEQKLQERERLADMGATAAMFAHEIGNPLAGMDMAVQAIKDTVPSENWDLFNIVESELNRLRSLLDQFRSLRSIGHLNWGSFDFARVIERVVSLYQGLWLERGIHIVSTCSGDLRLSGDEDKLEQVMLNLCKNGVESMANGGALTLRGYEIGEEIVFEVSDTGSGIPEGLDIFHLFTSTKPKGAGIGLYVVQQVVAAHHGAIRYTSDLGKGTTFRMTLPKSRNKRD